MTINMTSQWATRVALTSISSTCQKTCTEVSFVWEHTISKQFVTMFIGENLNVGSCRKVRNLMTTYRDSCLLKVGIVPTAFSMAPSSDQADWTLCLVRFDNFSICFELGWWETNLLNKIIQSEWRFQFQHNNITRHI